MHCAVGSSLQGTDRRCLSRPSGCIQMYSLLLRPLAQWVCCCCIISVRGTTAAAACACCEWFAEARTCVRHSTLLLQQAG
jgi:hypothetical protein